MINMIRADLYRIFKNIGIYIALGIMLLMIGVSIYTVSPGNIGAVTVGDIDTSQMNEDPYNNMSNEEMQRMSMKEIRNLVLQEDGYKLDRGILATNINLYYVFIFIAAIAVTIDFSGGCIKNTLSSAISRKKYFFSKTIVIFGICLFLFFLNTYVVYFSNLIFNGKNVSSDLWTVTKISLLQLPPVFALISVVNGLSFLLKRTSIYNMITIPLILVFQMILGVAIQIMHLSPKYINYELQIMLSRLADNPPESYIQHSFLLCALIIAVCNLTGYLSFRRCEINR